MPESNTSAAAGTADDTPLSLEQGVALLEEAESKREPGKPSDEEQAPADQPEAQDEEGKDEGDEPEADESKDDDSIPEWDREEKKPADGKTEYASETHKVKLADGSEATVGDLIHNGLRQSDYTRKTQQVAAERQALVQHFTQFQQVEQRVRQSWEAAMQVVASQVPPEPDINLINQDPIGYQQAKAYRDHRIGELTRLQQSYMQNNEQISAQQREVQNRMAASRQTEELDKLVSALPQLQDTKKREAFTNDIVRGFMSYGFQPAELSDLVDHRYVLLAADAMRYRRLMTNKDQAKQAGKQGENRTTTPVLKPVAGRKPESDTDLRKLQETFNKSGSMDDAIALDLAKQARRRRAARK